MEWLPVRVGKQKRGCSRQQHCLSPCPVSHKAKSFTEEEELDWRDGLETSLQSSHKHVCG